MQSSDKQKLKKQLEQEASKLVKYDGNELVNSVLSYCNALLKLSESVLQETKEKEVTDDIYANYLSIAIKVNRFYDAYSRKEDDDQLHSKLQKILNDISNQKEEKQALQSKLDSAISVNEEINTQIKDLQERINDQKKANEGLIKLKEEFRPELIAELKKKNAELLEEINKKKDNLDNLKSKHEELETERKETEDSIVDIENKIDKIPATIKELRAKYLDLKNVFEDLKDAEKEYSQEKQDLLKRQINELKPKIEEDRVSTEVLVNHLASLKMQYTQYDDEKHTLSTNVIDIINASLSDLEKHMKEYEGFINSTAERADALASNLCRCKARYEDYQNWYESSKTPLDAMINALGTPEYELLRNTLDTGQIPDIRNRFEEIRQNLLTIDDVLTKCTTALQKDIQRIKSRAEQ